MIKGSKNFSEITVVFGMRIFISSCVFFLPLKIYQILIDVKKGSQGAYCQMFEDFRRSHDICVFLPFQQLLLIALERSS